MEIGDVFVVICTILSLFISAGAFYVSYRAFKNFEYQVVKPKQIDLAFNFYERLKQERFMFDTVEHEGWQGGHFYFDGLQMVNIIGDHFEDKIITRDLNNKIIIFADYQFFAFLEDYYYNILFPISIKESLDKILVKPEEYIKGHNGDTILAYTKETGRTPLYVYNLPNINTFEDFISELKNVFKSIEEWLYKQGINNLNFQYYEPYNFLENSWENL